MFEKTRAFLLSLTIIAVLVFSAVGTTAVYADGGTTSEPPPTQTGSGGECSGAECDPPPTTSEEPPVVETVEPETVTVDTIGTEEVAPTEVPGDGAVEEEVTPVPAGEGERPVAEEASPVVVDDVADPGEKSGANSEKEPGEKKAPILDAVPENTTVTVLNSEGEPQPLATAAAADAIETSDPIWCPAGQAPTPGANGCTQSFSSFTALLTFLAGNASYTGAGTIYVQEGTYQGGETTIDFNNYNLSNISSSDLTITGGWNPSTGTTTTTSTFNNVSIIIGTSANPWGGSLTLSNLTITNSTNTGITANANGNITVSNVSVTRSKNGAGAELHSGNDVNINNSVFDRNKTAGAIITAKRNVAIANSSFSNPINSRTQIVGLDITADGAVSLLNVLANNNRQAGADIDAGGAVAIDSSVFSGTKAISGSDFLGYGLTVVTDSVINLNNVTANDNFLWGASLTSVGDVSIANSFFNGNTTESPVFIDDTGLLVDSQGNVSIINTQANENRLIGASIKAAGDVSISNSIFSGNNGVIEDSAGNPSFYGYGLQVVTAGSIFLEGVTASGNSLFGAHLDAGQDVFVSSSTFNDQTSGDAAALTGRGLEVIAGGNVRMQNVTLNGNQTFGANIQAGGNVFLDNVTADGNGTNGVEVQTKCGTLFLIGGTYQNNGQYGLSVLSTNLTQVAPPVFANNTAGNIFQDPGTCVFAPPDTPPAYKPNDLGAVTPVVPGATSFARAFKFAAGTLNLSTAATSAGSMSLNSFLANSAIARNTSIGLFTGNYAYVYLSSGMQIVLYSPGSLEEFALNGS